VANPEHVEIVREGTAEINKWRKANPHERLDLEKAKLTDLDLAKANLSFANLEFTRLSNVNLEDANLSHAHILFSNFNRSNLRYADLHESLIGSANFIKADLTYADLTLATISGSDLRGASLRRADLIGTNISDVKLLKADLTEAVTSNTIYSNIDLSQTVGLESIDHKGPCTLGIDTLIKSQGKIPEVFLRGCGLTDDFISYVPSLCTSNAIQFYSCFISYSHEDKSFARRLHDALQGRGIRCWLDEHQILPGDNIYDRIDHGIRVWDKVLLCASKHSLTSGWVDDELKHAFAKEKQLFKDRGCEVLSLIPLNLDGYLFSDWNHSKKNQVLERMAPDFTGWESDNAKFEQQLERVVKALQTNNTGREPEPKPKL
jgi:hypothetical protein